MATFNAEISLPIRGSSLLSFNLSKCTGNGVGCTPLLNFQDVIWTRFPIIIPDLEYGVITHIQLIVDRTNGKCPTETINLPINNIPTPTPTPTITPTVTPTLTPTITPTLTITPTITPTSEEVITPTPTLTITPTITPTLTPTITSTQILGSGCVTLSQSDTYTQIMCLNQGPYNVTTTTVTATLDEIAPVDVTVRFSGTTNVCTGAIQPNVFDITITAGQISNYIDVTTSTYVDCGQESTCQIETTSINIDLYDVLTQGYSMCVTPTPTPTLTLTPEPTVYKFYRAAEVIDSSISTTYCNNFPGGQGYNISSPFFTIDSVLIPGSTIIYSNSQLTTTVIGSWSLSNVTRMAYVTEAEYLNATVTPTTTNPLGGISYDGGIYKFMRVNSDGVLISTGSDSCTSDGGGGPEEPNIE